MNLIFITWFSATVSAIGLHVQFEMIAGLGVSEAPVFLSSLYNLVLLLGVGSALPKGKGQSADIVRVLNAITPLMVLSASFVAFGIGETLLGAIGAISAVTGLIWSWYDVIIRASVDS